MREPDSSSTQIGQDAHVQRVFQVYELLRTELEPLLHPKMLAEVLDRAASCVSAAATDDVLREMRAAVAGMLLDRVGQFLVSTQPEQQQLRPTLPTRARALHA